MIGQGLTVLRTAAGLAAAVIVAVSSGPRWSEFCATESRLRVISCCCTSIRNDAAHHLVCCVRDSHLEPSAVAQPARELRSITSAVAIRIARSARGGIAALAAGGSANGTIRGDTGRVLNLRI